MRKLVPLFVVLSCVASSTAFAAGGKDIESAPAVQFGTQQFGNTASDDGQPLTGCSFSGDEFNSWWNMDVAAGDRITIDWDAPLDHGLYVFPAGTTDFNVQDTEAAAYEGNGGNGKGQLVLTAARAGTMPVVFHICSYDASDAGPYSFTAYVQHGLVLSVPPMERLRRKATVTLGVHDPEGNPISSGVSALIEIRHDGEWEPVGVARVQAGAAIVSVKIARRFVGQRVKLRGVAGGPGYLTERSATQKVRIRRARRS